MDESFDSLMLDFDCEVGTFSGEEQIASWDSSIADLKEDITEKSTMMLGNRLNLVHDTTSLLQELTIVNQEIDSISLKVQNDLRPNFQVHAESTENKYSKAQFLSSITRSLENYLKCLSLHHKYCELLKHGKLEEASGFIKCQHEFSCFELHLRESNLCIDIGIKVAEFRRDFSKEMLKTFQNFCSLENFVFSLALPEDKTKSLIRIVENTDCFKDVAIVLREQIYRALKCICSSYKLKVSENFASMDLFLETTSHDLNLKEMLTYVELLFSCLNRTFLCYQHTGVSFIEKVYLGENFGNDLVMLIITEILEKKIPKTVNELDNYDYDALRKCENVLLDLKVTEKANCFEEFDQTLNKKFAQNFIYFSLADGRNLILGGLAEISIAYENKRIVIGEIPVKLSNGRSMPSLNEENSQFIQRKLETLPRVHVRLVPHFDLLKLIVPSYNFFMNSLEIPNF